MCRLLGIVADEPTEFHAYLRDAPRSLVHLSHEHRDGWGIAVHDATLGWTVQKDHLSAFADPRYGEVAGASRGRMLVAHVRRRTVGPVSFENTHPFQSGPWVFAHNGTIEDVDRLRSAASPERLSAARGTTDSEVFFAYLLTRLDAIGGAGPAVERTATEPMIDEVLAEAVAEMIALPESGAYNFLLGDGDTLYAFRQGRTLHVLEHPTNVLVASEALTDDPWLSVAEGTLLKVSRRPRPWVTTLAAL